MNLILSLLLITNTILIYLVYAYKSRLTHLKKSVEVIADKSFDLCGSAEQVANVSRDLDAASDEQLDTLNATISASHEINSMVTRTSDNTNDLKTEANQLERMSSHGSSIVDQMVTASLAIKESSEYLKLEIEKNMSELSVSLMAISEIASKTKMINDIVFQTKLLSFNASVEAARAGENGKGFSVVAEEIGKLAQMSGKTADDIAKIVDLSVNSINQVITTTKQRFSKLTDETVLKNETGYSSTKNCEKVFIDMTLKISSINKMIEEISEATKEQSLGVHQMDQAIIKLQEVADRNRLVASQSTEHAVEFNIQANQIVKINKEIASKNHFNTYHHPRLQKFIWKDSLSLGVDDMDGEHKILIEKINLLVTALEEQYTKKDKDKLWKAFLNLATYTTEHFKNEEQFMQSIGYAQLNSHQKIHQKLLEQVSQYGEQIKNGTIDDNKLISFLRNWLISHIMGVDMQYAKEAKFTKHTKRSA